MSRYKAVLVPSLPQDEAAARQNTVPSFSHINLARKWGRQVMKREGDRVTIYEIKEVEVETMEYDETKKVEVEVGL